jgi:hypothetical protein
MTFMVCAGAEGHALDGAGGKRAVVAADVVLVTEESFYDVG